MAMRDVVLAIFSEILSVRVDHGGRVEINAGHLDFVNRDDDHHAVFLRQLLHAGTVGPSGTGSVSSYHRACCSAQK